MTTVIGVDPSLTGTGLVTWRDGRWYARTVSTPAGMPTPERHHQIVVAALRMADRDADGRLHPERTLYVLEALIKPAGNATRGNAYLELAELRGVLNYGLHVKGYSRVDINPGTLKVYATGAGKASKQAMLTAARGRLEHVLPPLGDHNQADAAWLAVMALHRYGLEVWSPPAKNRRALTVPEWPPFVLSGE